MRLINILKQALQPSRFIVMIKKLWVRFFDIQGKLSKKELENWLNAKKVSYEELAANINKDLWNESLEISSIIKTDAAKTIKEMGCDLGGGGIYPLITFFVRILKPEVVVETGVAAGFSSYAVLESLRRNKKGRLYSSDFPYFRLPEPEKYIGIIVPDTLKNNWKLYIDGDRKNLPKIIAQVNNIDIFHFDSDKSYLGRKYAMDLIVPKMNADGLLIMDDIQDNSFFYDYVTSKKINEFYIFEFENKFVGLIGKLSKIQLKIG